MYHTPPRRQQLIRRTLVYTLMTLSVLSIVVLLVFMVEGYQLNVRERDVVRGGLVQFNSRPRGAFVTIDGKTSSDTTPSKTTLASGNHTIKMTRDGYRSWSKSVTVTPGEVLWLTYPRLFPNEIKTENVAGLTSITSSLTSPDNKKIVAVENPARPELELFDLSQENVNSRSLTLPQDSYTTKPKAEQSFTLTDWDPSSRYVLIRHHFADQTEWLVLDTESKENATVNVTKLLSIRMDSPVFATEDSQKLYAVIDGALRQIDLKAATLSRPLVQNVGEFEQFEDSTIVYSTRPAPDTKLREIGYFTKGTDKSRPIKTYSGNEQRSLHVAFGRYYGDIYVSIAYANNIEIFLSKLPKSNSEEALSMQAVASLSAPSDIIRLRTMTDGRFIMAEHGRAYSLYDLELDKTTTTKLEPSKTDLKLRWLDGYYVADTATGVLRLYEFDGENSRDVMPALPGQAVLLSNNSRYIYAFSKQPDGYHLTRAVITLD